MAQQKQNDSTSESTLNNSQDTIPKLYETDGIPFDEKQIHQVWYHRKVGFVWCIAEMDPDTGEAFGYANLNYDPYAEWGYIDIEDIKKNGAVMTPVNPAIPFKEVLGMVRPKNGCPKCGSEQYGCHIIRGKGQTDVPDTSELWICRKCSYIPFTNMGILN